MLQKGEPMDDLISRQAAIEALGEEPLVWHEGEDEIAERNQWRRDVNAIKALPSTQPELIRCKDCKHRPIATRADEGVLWGFSVEFPDERCPLQCEDGWYNYYPKDDFYCANAERRTDE